MANLLQFSSRNEQEEIEYDCIQIEKHESAGAGEDDAENKDHLFLIVQQYNTETAYKLMDTDEKYDDKENTIHSFIKALQHEEGLVFQFIKDASSSSSQQNSVHFATVAKSRKAVGKLRFQKVSVIEVFSSLVSATKTTFIKFRALELENSRLQSSLKKLVVQKNLMEDALYRAFTKCLNKKKEKIRMLEQKLDNSDKQNSTAKLKNSPVQDRKMRTRNKRKLTRRKAFSDTSSSSTDSDSEVDSGLSGNVVDEGKLYNVDTDIEEQEEERNTVNSKSNISTAIIDVKSSGSVTETDFSFDEDNSSSKPVFEKKKALSCSQVKRKSSVGYKNDAIRPEKKAKPIDISIPSDGNGSESEDLYDHELLLNDL